MNQAITEVLKSKWKLDTTTAFNWTRNKTANWTGWM